MKRGHVHNMVPDQSPKPKVFKCSSCAFRCTPAAVAEVNANPEVHILTRSADPQAVTPWEGSRR